MTRIAIFLSLLLISGAPGYTRVPAASPESVVPGREWRQADAPGDLGRSTETLDEARRWGESLDTGAVMIDDDAVRTVCPEYPEKEWVVTPRQLPDGHNLHPDAVSNAPLHDTSMKIPGDRTTS